MVKPYITKTCQKRKREALDKVKAKRRLKRIEKRNFQKSLENFLQKDENQV